MNKRTTPLVSVIVPAYNAARFLPESIPSVLAQTWTDFELIVVNDGSTDDTVACVEAFTDPRIRLVSQANRGLAGARNGGIRAARGSFIALLDADDLWHPEKLARHVAHLQSRPGVGVSYSASAFMDDAGRDMHLMQTPKLQGRDAARCVFAQPGGQRLGAGDPPPDAGRHRVRRAHRCRGRALVFRRTLSPVGRHRMLVAHRAVHAMGF